MTKIVGQQHAILRVSSLAFGLWAGYLIYTINLQDNFPAVQTIYPSNFRLLPTPLGLLSGTFVTPILMDKYKSRQVLFFGAYNAILAVVVMPFAFAPEVLFVYRYFFGMSLGLLFMRYCMFVSTVVPSGRIVEYSSYLVNGFGTGAIIAGLTAYVTYDDGDFVRAFRIPYFVGIGMLIGWIIWDVLFMPDTTGTLFKEGKNDQARELIAEFLEKPMVHEDVNERYKELQSAQKMQEVKRPWIIEPLINSKLRKNAILTGVFMYFIFSSFPASIIFYGTTLLQTNFDGKTNILVSVVFSIFFFVSSLFARILIKKITAKISLALTSLVLFILAIILCFVQVISKGYAIVIVALYGIISSISIIIAFTFVMQVFHEEAKSRSIACAFLSGWFGAIISLLIYLISSLYLDMPKLSIYAEALFSLGAFWWYLLVPMPNREKENAFHQSRRELLGQSTLSTIQ